MKWVLKYKIFKFNKYLTKHKSFYVKKGFSFMKLKNHIIVIYNRKHYIINVERINRELFWKIEPYNNSYFLTKCKNLKNFKILLFTIEENDKLYN